MASCGNLKPNFMKNIDINEWLLNNNIDPLTEIVADGKQWFLSDILEKHLKEQFAIHNVSNCGGAIPYDSLSDSFKKSINSIEDNLNK